MSFEYDDSFEEENNIFNDALPENIPEINKNFYVEQDFDKKAVFFNSGISGKIQSLSELFIEWYLFDSSESKDISAFLKSEQIDDIFTPEQFMDLMCGNAFLDELLIDFIYEILPFRILKNKIDFLNYMASENDTCQYCIKVSDSIILAKQKEIIVIKKEKAKLQFKKWVQENPERKKELQRIFKENNPQYFKQYYDKNKEQISANDKEYREKNKDYLKDYLKEYYETNKDYYKQKYLEFKTRRENAKKVCPTFIYLTMLRKQDLQLYLTVYKQHEDVVGKTARNCTALQNMDFNLCPFSQNIGSDSEMKENCPMTKAFDLPDSFNFIRKYSEQLKQNSK